MEECELSAAKNGDECTEEVEETREVEYVGPEEDSARGSRADREA